LFAWFDVKGSNYQEGKRLKEDFDVVKAKENSFWILELAKEEIMSNLDGNSKWLWMGGKGIGSLQAAQVASFFKEFIGGLMMIWGGLTPVTETHEIQPRAIFPIIYFGYEDDTEYPFDYIWKEYEWFVDNYFDIKFYQAKGEHA